MPQDARRRPPRAPEASPPLSGCPGSRPGPGARPAGRTRRDRWRGRRSRPRRCRCPGTPGRRARRCSRRRQSPPRSYPHAIDKAAHESTEPNTGARWPRVVRGCAHVETTTVGAPRDCAPWPGVMLPHAADAGGSGTSGVAFVLAAALRAVGRRRWLPAFLACRTRMPVRALLAVVGVRVGVDLVGDRLPRWFEQAAALGAIAAAAWLVAVVLPACTDAALTDAVRLDDVIAVDGEWGRVEEITATSVLLQAWDDRRVVVPSRRLTGAAFENWTRRTADLVGTVDLDIDPGIPVVQVRAELVRLVEGNDLWDRRVAVLQVADATGGRVRVRAVVSAVDAPRLMDLRSDVREALVEWLRVQVPSRGPGPDLPIRPRHTVELLAGTPGAEAPDRTVRVDPRRDARLFTGSVFAVERSQAFIGPVGRLRPVRRAG